MIKAARIITIISAVLISLSYILVAFLFLFTSHYGFIVSIILFIAIIPTILITVFVLLNINKATKASDLLIWGILSLLFISPISGIFLLCAKDEDVAKYKEEYDNNLNSKLNNNKLEQLNNEKINLTEKLAQLKELREKNIISEEEYKEKREKYLGDF